MVEGELQTKKDVIKTTAASFSSLQLASDKLAKCRFAAYRRYRLLKSETRLSGGMRQHGEMVPPDRVCVCVRCVYGTVSVCLSASMDGRRTDLRTYLFVCLSVCCSPITAPIMFQTDAGRRRMRRKNFLGKRRNTTRLLTTVGWLMISLLISFSRQIDSCFSLGVGCVALVQRKAQTPLTSQTKGLQFVACEHPSIFSESDRWE